MTGKDYLSQEEIDALLRQSEESAQDISASEGTSTNIDDYLNSLEQDALGEIGNISFGSAATALSTLLGKKVEITTPKVSVIPVDRLEDEFPTPHVAVHVRYVEGFEGINLLVIRTDDAKVIADLMLGGDGTNVAGELNEIHISAVQEAMNQMMGSAATSMSTIFNRFVNISPPGIDIMDIASGVGTDRLPQEDVFIQVSFRLTIEHLIDSSIMQLLPVWFAKDMVKSLMGGAPMESEKEAASAKEQPAPKPQQSPASFHSADSYEPASGMPHHAGYAMQQPMTPPHAAQQPVYQQPTVNRNINAQPVQYQSFESMPSVYADEPNLNLLLDIPLKITVELGRTKKLIKEILELSQGSIIELDKLAGEPVDILANNKLIAKGEVVVIDENFGVRVTDIVSPTDRLKKLQ
jgi:flagellar motor switch protein FliN/FliY